MAAGPCGPCGALRHTCSTSASVTAQFMRRSPSRSSASEMVPSPAAGARGQDSWKSQPQL